MASSKPKGKFNPLKRFCLKAPKRNDRGDRCCLRRFEHAGRCRYEVVK
jgi:hypothetical protein